jgi:hypothetical protein
MYVYSTFLPGTSILADGYGTALLYEYTQLGPPPLPNNQPADNRLSLILPFVFTSHCMFYWV